MVALTEEGYSSCTHATLQTFFDRRSYSYPTVHVTSPSNLLVDGAQVVLVVCRILIDRYSAYEVIDSSRRAQAGSDRLAPPNQFPFCFTHWSLS